MKYQTSFLIITTKSKETKMSDQEDELKPSKFKQIQVTQVSNGFITEISHSSEPNQDGQERASVHPTLEDLLNYLEETFEV